MLFIPFSSDFCFCFVLFSIAVTTASISASTTAKPRIGIVEDHHHVLWHALDAVNKGVLPKQKGEEEAGGEGVTLIHFDSHADMSLIETHLFDVNEMYEHPFEMVRRSEINNWVTTIWTLGIVNRMIYVEPPWGIEMRHLPYSHVIFTIGKKNNDYKLHVRTNLGKDVSSEFMHLVTDFDMPNHDKFCAVEEMSEKREIEVVVMKLEDNIIDKILYFIQNDKEKSNNNKSNSKNKIMISVDMDVFSTESPSHLWFLREADIPMRYQHFLATTFLNFTHDLTWWRQQLQGDLQAHCPSEHVNEEQDEPLPLDVNISTLPPLDSESLASQLFHDAWPEENAGERDIVVRVWQLFEEQLRGLLDKFDEDTVREHFANLVRYPVYMGTRPTIRFLQSVMQCLFTQMHDRGHIPQLVTLSRSPEYLPLHLLNEIECGMLQMLRTSFPTIKDLYYEHTIRDFSTYENGKTQKGNCREGYILHAVEGGEEVSAQIGAPVPIDFVIMNHSPETVKVLWRDSFDDENNKIEWNFRETVLPQGMSDTVTRHGHQWEIRTLEDVVVGHYAANERDGHTASITITTRQVDDALVAAGIFRHRDI